MTTTKYCSECCTNCPSALFTHPFRAVSYEVCSNCRSKPDYRSNSPVLSEQEIKENLRIDNDGYKIPSGHLTGDYPTDPFIIKSTMDFVGHYNLLKAQGFFKPYDPEEDEDLIDNNDEPIYEDFYNEESVDDVDPIDEEEIRKSHSWFKPLDPNRPIPAGYRSQYDKNMPVHYLGKMDSVCPFCKALHWPQERVPGSTIENPRFKSCCDEGRFVPPSPRP